MLWTSFYYLCAPAVCPYTIFADNNPDVKKAIEEVTDKYVNVLDKYKDSTYKLDFNTFTTNININGNIYEYSLFGDYQYKNFLCAYEVLKYLGIDENIIKEAIKKFDGTLVTGSLKFDAERNPEKKVTFIEVKDGKLTLKEKF